MSEWWTYRLEDFLMFAPVTYQRLFALHNAAVWPWQVPAAVLALLAVWAGRAMGGRPALWRLALLPVAAGWLATAAGFLWTHYASIHIAAPWFAAAFGLQALLLATLLRPGSPWRARLQPGWVRGLGLLLLALAVLGWPLLGPLFGRPWTQLALFGLTPDATAVGTLGLLLLLQRQGRSRALPLLPWAVPVLWCVLSAATLWTLGMPDGLLLAATVVLALVPAAWWLGRTGPERAAGRVR
ncbi:DUF6064 family protein [Pseudorhodoferax sp.]|uniref:DUF6064 family protein n=1 Tax=Pseudorhodoferax sp. TaxID=1993553 RepID=UPI002DD66D07|nr:DUF6064 family protein [Pseudorhodoferax sp.]